jgi:two-component system sensor histidine kinase/response regulator
MNERADPHDRDTTPRRSALRAATAYGLLGSSWLFASAWLLRAWETDPSWLLKAGLINAGLFIAPTAAMLYILLRGQALPRRQQHSAPTADSMPRRLRLTPLSALSIAVVGVTALVLRHDYGEEVAHQSAQVEAVAELRATQITLWLNDRLSQAAFARSSSRWEGIYRRWRERDDSTARDQLMSRLIDLRKSFGDHSVLVVDEHGDIVADETGAVGAASPQLRSVALRAMSSGELQHTDLYTVADTPWLDVVAPLAAGGLPAKGAVVFRQDPRKVLFPMLKSWPSPSQSGTTLLVRREAGMLIGASGKKVLADQTPDLLAARAVRGEVPFGAAAEGIDFRGVPVLGAVRPVAGTNWFLVAKIDRSEVRAAAFQKAVWILATGLLALLGTVVVGVLFRDRRTLDMVRADQAEKDQRLRALALTQAIAEGSSDAIFAKDREGRYLLCNGPACRVMGKTRDEVLGADDTALFSAEQATAIRNHDARVIADDQLDHYEQDIGAPDQLRTFLVTKGPLHDENGQVVGVFGISRDITERKRAEASLRESEATNRTLLVAMADGMFVAQDHRFVFANPALPRMLGYADGGFVGLPFDAVVAPAFLDLWTQRFEQRVGSGPEPAGHYEVQFLRRGGHETLWIELRASRFQFRGRPAVLGLVRDVSERRRTQSLLEGDLQRRRVLVEESRDGIVVLDEDGKVFEANASFAELVGHGLDALRTMHVWDWDLSWSRERMLEALGAPAVGGFGFESVLRRSDGAQRHIDVRANTVSIDGQRLTFCVCRDITDRKQSEQEMREVSELVRAVGDSLLSQMAVLDRSGLIVRVNEAWRQFGVANGTDADAARTGVGSNYLAVCRSTSGPQSDDAVAAANGIAAVLSGQQVQFTMEYACHAPHQPRWFNMSVTPLRKSAGGAVVVHADITQRRLAEDALRESEAQYRSVVSVLAEGIIVFDPQGRVRTCNAQAERLFGMNMQQMQQPDGPRQWQPLNADGSSMSYEDRPLIQTLRTGEPCRNVLVGAVLPGRGMRWMSINAEPVLDEHTGAVASVVTSIIDITERHQAQQELRKLSLAVEQSPMGIVIRDIEGRIEYVNDAFTRISGFTREEAVGQFRHLLQSRRTPPGRGPAARLGPASSATRERTASHLTNWSTLRRSVSPMGGSHTTCRSTRT